MPKLHSNRSGKILDILPSLQILILAAGHSHRFGSDKRLLTLQTVLNTVLSALPAAECLCVLRASDAGHLKNLLGVYQGDSRLRILWNAAPELGMGYSLALGAHQLQTDVAMVLLADMPYIQPQTLQRLVAGSSAETIVAPVYAGERGHPVIFGKAFFAELQQLQGDSGARQVLEKYRSKVVLLDVDDVGVVHDVDVPGQLMNTD